MLLFSWEYMIAQMFCKGKGEMAQGKNSAFRSQDSGVSVDEVDR